MTTVRDRLTAALREAMFNDPDWAMVCDPVRLADKVLALPGIAIVALPEARHCLHNWTHFGTVAIYSAKPGLINTGVNEWCPPERAREYAAALLAAAAEVER